MLQKEASIPKNESQCLKEIIHLPFNPDRRELMARSRFMIHQLLPLQVQIQADTPVMNFHQVLVGKKVSSALPSLCVLFTSQPALSLFSYGYVFAFAERAKETLDLRRNLVYIAPVHNSSKAMFHLMVIVVLKILLPLRSKTGCSLL